eukprot:3787369-Prymnesium_polylepis.1
MAIMLPSGVSIRFSYLSTLLSTSPSTLPIGVRRESWQFPASETFRSRRFPEFREIRIFAEIDREAMAMATRL